MTDLTHQLARNQARTRRAHAYARRRVLNILCLLAGNAVTWTLTALIVNAAARQLGWAAVSTTNWQVLFVLHSLLLFGAKLLPGWGLGIVAELRYNTQIAALIAMSFAVASWSQVHGLRGPTLGVTLAVTLILLAVIVRAAVKHALLRAGRWGVPVVVYGAAATGERVIRALLEEPGLGYHPAGLYDDNPARQGQQVAGVPVAGTTVDWTLEAPIAILAMPGAGRGRSVELLDGPLSVYRNVIVIPDLFDVQSLWARTRDLGGILGIDINYQLADPVARRTKRAIDLLAVLLTSPLWAPLCLLLALLIWLEDRADPLFLQPRLGLGGETFSTWKFRTMVPDAEAVLQRRLAEDPALKAEWEANFKLRRDPRITRVGAFLRKTSLDELPQLVNVLRGEMALVGPRPLPKYHYDLLPAPVQHLRREVRPGMTGLWQVSGRSDAGNDGMIQHDPYYVRNWSVWLDAVILLRTFRAVIRSSGAY
ncbi:exopolysaccharide biosynthesis polyprenyl glycosylphosphotransferase [Deinococcus knuensis]|nr:exopolysaccharide biosynthesis polyprenyl glycosylphosphotransferase [Deinococcus knuensis]